MALVMAITEFPQGVSLLGEIDHALQGLLHRRIFPLQRGIVPDTDLQSLHQTHEAVGQWFREVVLFP